MLRRPVYRYWAMAGLVLCVPLSLIAAGLAIFLLYLMVSGAVAGRALGPDGTELAAFFYLIAAALPFWCVAVFSQILRGWQTEDRDQKLRRSAFRLIWWIAGVTTLVCIAWLPITGAEWTVVFALLALHWGVVMPPLVILVVLTQIVSPIGREERLAHVF